MLLEYLASNALNKYPFKDNAYLRSIDGQWVFKNDFFLDTVVVAKTYQVEWVYLQSYQNDTVNSVVRITYEDNYSNTIPLIIPYSNITDRGVYTFANDQLAVKIVFGHAATVAITNGINTVYQFIQAATQLETSAVVQMVPRVGSISFYNWNNTFDTPESAAEASFAGNETIPMAITVLAGSNVAFDFTTTGAVNIDVEAGNGTGLYNPCADNLVIKTIDDTGPDGYGNFILSADDCYTEHAQTYGLYIENNCTPKCTSDQMGAFAHYLNRVKDGITTITTYAEQIADDLEAEYQHFVNVIIPQKNTPYSKLQAINGTVNETKSYVSCSVGFFNPTQAAINLTASLSTTGTIVTENFPINISVECLKSHVADFVVTGTPGTSVAINATLGGINVSQTVTI